MMAKREALWLMSVSALLLGGNCSDDRGSLDGAAGEQGITDVSRLESSPVDRSQPNDADTCFPTTLSFTATADAHVNQGSASSNYGSATTLLVDQGPDQEVYLRFGVSVPGAVTGARLRINVTNGSSNGPAVHTTSSGWQESSINWNNRPAPVVKLAALGNVGTGWTEIDLGASAVTGNGDQSFVLVPTSSDGLDLSSRESTNGPRLLVASSCGGPRPDGGKLDGKIDGPPPVAGAFRFVAWGDTKSATQELSTLSDQAALSKPAFTIYAGDMVGSWSDAAMNTWRQAAGGQLTNDATYGTKPNGLFEITFTVRGNHEGSGSGYMNWMNANHPLSQAATQIGAKSYVNMPGQANQVYSFDYSNAHFVGLDALGGACTVGAAQVAWLDTDLAAAEGRGVQHSFIFFHGPIYCVDGHCSCTTRTCVETCGELAALIAVLNKHASVSATFHGHEHIYTHTYLDSSRDSRITHPFHQFVTGDAGAGPQPCDKTNRFDYCMDSTSDGKAGFTTVDVNGKNVTVTFYKSGITTAQKVVTHAMP